MPGYIVSLHDVAGVGGKGMTAEQKKSAEKAAKDGMTNICRRQLAKCKKKQGYTFVGVIKKWDESR